MQGVGALGQGSSPQPGAWHHCHRHHPLAMMARAPAGVWVLWTSATEARAEGHGNDRDYCGNPFEDSLRDQETLQGRGRGPAFIWVLRTIEI